MKEFLEKHRPLRQRKVREETTKGKAVALPPTVHTKQQDFTKVNLLAGLRNDFNSGHQPVGLSSDEGAVQATSEGGNVTDVTFADDCIVSGTCGNMQTNMTRTQKMTFLKERMKILPQLRFPDPGDQFAPIFVGISKVRLQ